MQGSYRSLGYLLLVLPLIIVAGFWLPHFSQAPESDPSITLAVQIHALLIMTWIALRVIPPLTIRNRAYSIHRLPGKASYALMPLVVIFCVLMLRKEYQEHLAGGMNGAAARSAEYLLTIQLMLFDAFYVLAIAHILGRDLTEHMRPMICIAVVLLPASLARTSGYGLALSRRRRNASRPSIVALAAYLIAETGWLALGRPV